MRQWRISSPGQQARQRIARIIEAFEGTEKAITYPHETLKVYSDSGWEQDHENEFLVGREPFTIADKAFQNKPHIDSRGRILISILTYRDKEIAKAEMERRKNRNVVSPFQINIAGNYEAVLTLENTVVVITDHSRTQQKRVEKIAERLRELLK